MEMVEDGQSQPRIPRELQKIVEKGEEDRISALPDCLLLEILSRLPCTKGAIRTGTLSKRWKNLWTALPSLVFIHSEDNHAWSDFVSCVDKTLIQCSQVKLKKFQVDATYYTGFESQVNNWIRYATRCNVEELNLMFRNMDPEVGCLVDQFFFISSCFTDLRLSCCILNPTGAISWKNLRSLRISDGYLDEELIENILSGSPVLETLVLEDCYGYKLLNITSKSVHNLVFFGYNDHQDEYDMLYESIEINAPNILSLKIIDDLLLRKLLLLNVSSLVKAELNYTRMGHWGTTRKEEEEEMLKGLILSLSHVKDLRIGCSCYKVLNRLEAKGFVFSSNMKFRDGSHE